MAWPWIKQRYWGFTKVPFAHGAEKRRDSPATEGADGGERGGRKGKKYSFSGC